MDVTQPLLAYRRGKPFSYHNLYGSPPGLICSRPWRGGPYKRHNLYAYPAGAYFCSCASSRATLHVGSPRLRMGQPSNAPPLLLSPPGLATRRGPQSKTRLGRCPKTPVAGCAGYGLIFDGSPKSIRTAHRYAPKVACGGICPYRLAVPEKIFALFVCSIFSTATDSPPRFIRHRRRSAPNPPTPFPDGGKGARMGGRLETESNALGVLGLAKNRTPLTHGYG